jgi:hypothetical protein
MKTQDRAQQRVGSESCCSNEVQCAERSKSSHISRSCRESKTAEQSITRVALVFQRRSCCCCWLQEFGSSSTLPGTTHRTEQPDFQTQCGFEWRAACCRSCCFCSWQQTSELTSPSPAPRLPCSLRQHFHHHLHPHPTPTATSAMGSFGGGVVTRKIFRCSSEKCVNSKLRSMALAEASQYSISASLISSQWRSR